MRLFIALSVAASLVVVPLFSPEAETVSFRSATTPPTPLQLRLAKERGEPVAEQPTTELVGELYRPPGNGPFPAVVVLHGCGGRGQRANEDDAGVRYTALGYVLLIVDSFGPRDFKQRCTIEAGSTVDRLMDAYGGLLFLAGLSFVDADRIAVIGYSQGGGVALDAVELGGVEAAFNRRFRVAIAYYPPCPYSLDVAVPTLILIGAIDDWALARDCRDMMTRRTGSGAPLRLIVYPDAYHGFNVVNLRKPATYLGHHLEYNEAAAKAAWDELLAALKEAFGR